MLGRSWPTVYDAGPALPQYRVNESCLLDTVCLYRVPASSRRLTYSNHSVIESTEDRLNPVQEQILPWLKLSLNLKYYSNTECPIGLKNLSNVYSWCTPL